MPAKSSGNILQRFNFSRTFIPKCYFQKSEIWKPAIAGYYSIKSLTDLAHKNDMIFDVLFVQFHKKTTYTSFTQFRISNSPLPVLYKYFKHFTRLNVSPICRKSCNIKCSELISILLFKKKKKIQAHSEQHSKHNFQVQVQPRFVSYTHSKNNWITITRFHWNDNTVNK